jgi:hypothetical protein
VDYVSMTLSYVVAEAKNQSNKTKENSSFFVSETLNKLAIYYLQKLSVE